MSKRVVLVTFGSLGDLNPFLGIGRELRERGYETVIASSAEWQTLVENGGLEFRSIWPGFDSSIKPNQLMEYMVGKAMHGLSADLRASYDDLLSAVRDADALVALTLAIAAPLVARKISLPWV